MSWFGIVTNRDLQQQLNRIEGKVDHLMTESSQVEAATQQIETDVAAINAALAPINTALADLVAKVNAGGSVSAADLEALQSAVTGLNNATGGVQASATTAQADDPGPTP